MTEAVAQHAQHQGQQAQQADAGQSDHRAQGMYEGLERNRHEHQREWQDESHAHLRRGGDPQEAVLDRRLAAAQQRAGRELVLQQHFAHVGEPRFDAREQQQDGEGDPDHAHAHLVGQRADHRERVA